MPSPFASLENATLTFKSSSQSMEIDEWGNRLPVQEDFVVRCWLKEYTNPREGDSVKESVYAGVSESLQTLAGYCIEPQFLPESITHFSEAIAVISGQKGRFILYRGLDGMATSITGTSIKGLFRRTL